MTKMDRAVEHVRREMASIGVSIIEDCHKCALPECNRRIPRSLLVCSPHWKMATPGENAKLERIWFSPHCLPVAVPIEIPA